MADVDDGDAALVPQPLDVGEDLLPAGGIERGQRLVHEQEAGGREQGPADRDPLSLPSGQPPGAAGKQVADAEQVDDAPDAFRRLARPREPAAVEEVAAHAQVREKARLLEDIADPPPVAGNEVAAPGVDQHLAVDDDASPLGPVQAGDQVYERRFAAPGRAEQRGQARIRTKAGAE